MGPQALQLTRGLRSPHSMLRPRLPQVWLWQTLVQHGHTPSTFPNVKPAAALWVWPLHLGLTGWVPDTDLLWGRGQAGPRGPNLCLTELKRQQHQPGGPDDSEPKACQFPHRTVGF